MNMNAFTTYATEHIKDYLPPAYLSADVKLDTVEKLDDQYTGLMVRIDDKPSAPIANLDNFFREYQDSGSLDMIMTRMAEVLQMEAPFIADLDALSNYAEVKKKLFVRLSLLDNSEAIIAGSPHTVISDMAMTYHIFVKCDDDADGFLSARITNAMLDGYGVSEKELHHDALRNTTFILEPKIQSMLEALTGVSDDDPTIMIVTNQEAAYGAGILFCEGVMPHLADVMGGDYFIIPSSIHEMLAVPDNGTHTAADLLLMLTDANATVVRPEEVLSRHIYHYDSAKQLFEVAK